MLGIHFTRLQLFANDPKDFSIAPRAERSALLPLAELRARRICSSATDRSPRHGRVNSEGAFDDQLSLFDFARGREQTNLSDSVRTDGRTPLAGIPSEHGSRTGGEGHVDGSTLRGAGGNNRRNGSADEKLETEQKLTPQTSARSRLGNDWEKYVLLPPEESR